MAALRSSRNIPDGKVRSGGGAAGQNTSSSRAVVLQAEAFLANIEKRAKAKTEKGNDLNVALGLLALVSY